MLGIVISITVFYMKAILKQFWFSSTYIVLWQNQSVTSLGWKWIWTHEVLESPLRKCYLFYWTCPISAMTSNGPPSGSKTMFRLRIPAWFDVIAFVNFPIFGFTNASCLSGMESEDDRHWPGPQTKWPEDHFAPGLPPPRRPSRFDSPFVYSRLCCTAQ